MTKLDEAQQYIEQLIDQINSGKTESNKLQHSTSVIKDAFGNNHTIHQHSHAPIENVKLDGYQARYLIKLIVDAAVEQIKDELANRLTTKVTPGK